MGTDIVFDFWGDLALSMWEGNETLIMGMRKGSGEPRMFEFWEFLAKEMKKRKTTQSKKFEAKASIKYLRLL